VISIGRRGATERASSDFVFYSGPRESGAA